VKDGRIVDEIKSVREIFQGVLSKGKLPDNGCKTVCVCELFNELERKIPSSAAV